MRNETNLNMALPLLNVRTWDIRKSGYTSASLLWIHFPFSRLRGRQNQVNALFTDEQKTLLKWLGPQGHYFIQNKDVHITHNNHHLTRSGGGNRQSNDGLHHAADNHRKNLHGIAPSPGKSGNQPAPYQQIKGHLGHNQTYRIHSKQHFGSDSLVYPSAIFRKNHSGTAGYAGDINAGLKLNRKSGHGGISLSAGMLGVMNTVKTGAAAENKDMSAEQVFTAKNQYNGDVELNAQKQDKARTDSGYKVPVQVSPGHGLVVLRHPPGIFDPSQLPSRVSRTSGRLDNANLKKRLSDVVPAAMNNLKDYMLPEMSVPLVSTGSVAGASMQTYKTIVTRLEKTVETRFQAVTDRQLTMLAPLKQSIESINQKLIPERIASDELVKIIVKKIRGYLREERSRMGVLQ